MQEKKTSITLEIKICVVEKASNIFSVSPTRYHLAHDVVYRLTHFNQDKTVEVTLITDFQILCNTATIRKKLPFSSGGDSLRSVVAKWHLQVRGKDK